jgi:hypothetical protein
MTDNNYATLRAQALHWKCPQVVSTTSDTRAHPCAVVMDWALGTAVATVIALSDGTASIYYSNGGGFIGGGQGSATIRETAIHAVSIAGRLLADMLPTSDFPLPENDSVIFYVVTERGVYMAKASVASLSTNRHPLTAIGNDMQTIITAYRKIDSIKK